jgi:hypothetical protein
MGEKNTIKGYVSNKDYLLPQQNKHQIMHALPFFNGLPFIYFLLDRL